MQIAEGIIKQLLADGMTIDQICATACDIKKIADAQLKESRKSEIINLIQTNNDRNRLMIQNALGGLATALLDANSTNSETLIEAFDKDIIPIAGSDSCCD